MAQTRGTRKSCLPIIQLHTEVNIKLEHAVGSASNPVSAAKDPAAQTFAFKMAAGVYNHALPCRFRYGENDDLGLKSGRAVTSGKPRLLRIVCLYPCLSPV